MTRQVLLLFALISLGAGFRVDGPEDRKGWYEERIPVLLAEVGGALGVRPPDDITVRLAPTDEEFARESRGAPEWAAAVALPEERTLVVRLKAVGTATGQDVSSVLRHELVHLVLPYRVGGIGRVPKWFEEGLAEVVGGPVLRVDRETLPITAAAGRLIPLSSLERSFPRSAGAARLAYAEGESAVRFMIDRAGSEGLGELLDSVRRDGDFVGALARVTGVSTADFPGEWREWIRKESEPWWLTILSVATIPLLLFVASLLVIGAWFRARRRGRRIYESLPE